MTDKAVFYSGLSGARLAATILLGCSLSVSAFASNNKMGVCRTADVSMPTADPAVERLVVSPVDHYPAESTADITKPIDQSADDINTVAPTLSLTPRVASILERVFSDETDELPATREGKRQTLVPHKERIGKNPISENAPLEPELLIEDSTSEIDVAPAKVHARMLRKDI